MKVVGFKRKVKVTDDAGAEHTEEHHMVRIETSTPKGIMVVELDAGDFCRACALGLATPVHLSAR